MKFSDGASFDSAAVKFSFERAKDAKSTNKAKGAVFNNITHISTPDAHTVVLVLTNPDGQALAGVGEGLDDRAKVLVRPVEDHHPAPARAANGHRLAAQARVIALFDAGEEGIHVDMDDLAKARSLIVVIAVRWLAHVRNLGACAALRKGSANG